MSALIRKLLEAREGHQLTSLTIELTYDCELDCVICYNDRSRTDAALSFEEIGALLDDAAALGCLFVTLTGGEPTRHPRFFEIGARARAAGFAVRLKSNLDGMDAEARQRLVAEVDPFHIETSLHGADARTHERQTRVPGSFDRLVENLRGLRAARIPVQVNAPLTRWNEAQIEEMYDLCDGLEVPLRFDPEITPRDDGDQAPLRLSPSPEGVAKLRAVQATRGASLAPSDTPLGPTGYHCGAGTSALHVDPFGLVFPCVQWRRPLGDLRSARLRDMWAGDAVSEVREDNAAAARAKLGPKHCPGRARRGRALPIAS